MADGVRVSVVLDRVGGGVVYLEKKQQKLVRENKEISKAQYKH